MPFKKHNPGCPCCDACLLRRDTFNSQSLANWTVDSGNWSFVQTDPNDASNHFDWPTNSQPFLKLTGSGEMWNNYSEDVPSGLLRCHVRADTDQQDFELLIRSTLGTEARVKILFGDSSTNACGELSVTVNGVEVTAASVRPTHQRLTTGHIVWLTIFWDDDRLWVNATFAYDRANGFNPSDVAEYNQSYRVGALGDIAFTPAEFGIAGAAGAGTLLVDKIELYQLVSQSTLCVDQTICQDSALSVFDPADASVFTDTVHINAVLGGWEREEWAIGKSLPDDFTLDTHTECDVIVKEYNGFCMDVETETIQLYEDLWTFGYRIIVKFTDYNLSFTNDDDVASIFSEDDQYELRISIRTSGGQYYLDWRLMEGATQLAIASQGAFSPSGFPILFYAPVALSRIGNQLYGGIGESLQVVSASVSGGASGSGNARAVVTGGHPSAAVPAYIEWMTGLACNVLSECAMFEQCESGSHPSIVTPARIAITIPAMTSVADSLTITGGTFVLQHQGGCEWNYNDGSTHINLFLTESGGSWTFTASLLKWQGSNTTVVFNSDPGSYCDVEPDLVDNDGNIANLQYL